MINILPHYQDCELSIINCLLLIEVKIGHFLRKKLFETLACFIKDYFSLAHFPN